ncbi:hypothetical protein [Streptomyces cathayae]|uniref:Uncharacterized protein n=1 Tax=Streptomyces cathayae TaxID=3031124 RepID=A0ABY8K5H5_9ACTN|nr:hypothetical protein [Streptomyces sp. HUAS 5]WGD42010.1 hypothetical protein PYS65_18605 [Streptomyces sp. HUAS 5]
MDSTQAVSKKSPVPGAMLVTSLGLGAGNIGFAAGIFGRLAGDQTLYAATATGVFAGAGAFTLALTIASFIRKNSES